MAADPPNPSSDFTSSRPPGPVRAFFLPVTRFDPNVGARDAYLQQSDARSHAAKVSHARLKRKQEQKAGRAFYRNALDPSPQVPRRRHHNPSPQWPRFEGASMHVRTPSMMGNVPQCLCNGGLDPFLQIADDVRNSDRLQLQSYLNTSAQTHQGYKRSNFCPTRDILIPKLAMSAPLVQCILLISDYASRATPLAIESRRGQVIQQIRSTLLQPETHALPATAVAIATLIVAEYRGGEMDAVQFHCRGLKSWVDARGGLDVIDAYFDPFTIMALLVAFVYFDVPLFDSNEELDAALDRLELLPVSTQETPATLKKYCFPSELGSQVAVLYVLSTVQQLGLDDVFAELAYRLETSAPVAPGAMLYMVVSAAWRYRRSHVALSTRRIVEFVSLLSLAPARARRRMLGGMSRRLTGTEMPDRPIIPLDELRDEIRAAWASRGSGESPGSAGQPRTPTGLPLRNAGEGARRVCPYLGPGATQLPEPGPARQSPSSMSAHGHTHTQMNQLPSPTSTPSPHSSSSASTMGEPERRVCPYIPPRQTPPHEWS